MIETYKIDVDGKQIKIEEIDMDGITVYGVKTKLENKEKYEKAAEAVETFLEKLEDKKSDNGIIGAASTQCSWNHDPGTGVGIDGDARSFNEADSCTYNNPFTGYWKHTIKQGGWIEGRWYGSSLPDKIKIGARYDFDGWTLSLSFPPSASFKKLDGNTVQWTSETVSGYWYLRTAHQELSASTYIGIADGSTVTTNAEIYKGGNIYRPKVSVKHGF